MNLTFECPIHFTGQGRRRRSLRTGPAPALSPLPAGTVPRISRLMALAIRLDRLLATGAVVDLASLARRFRVTRARITQIMALNRLAPNLQEALLFLPRTVSGRAALTERELRAVAAEADWGRQREAVRHHGPFTLPWRRQGGRKHSCDEEGSVPVRATSCLVMSCAAR